MVRWMKNNPPAIIIATILVGFIMILNVATATSPKPDWEKFAKELPYADRPKLIRKAGIVAFQPEKLTFKEVKKEYGNPIKSPRIVIQEYDNEEIAFFDRPEVLTLNIYANIVFVQSDFSARPDEIVLVMVKE